MNRPRSDPDECHPGPALMTPRRLGRELESIAADLSRISGRLIGLAAYLDQSRRFTEVAADLHQWVTAIYELRGRVLSGDLPLDPKTLDTASWREHRPLIAAIEARAGADGQHAEPAIAAAEEPNPTSARGTALPTAEERIRALTDRPVLPRFEEWILTPVSELVEISDEVQRLLSQHGMGNVGAIVGYVRAGKFLSNILGGDKNRVAGQRRAHMVADGLLMHQNDWRALVPGDDETDAKEEPAPAPAPRAKSPRRPAKRSTARGKEV